MAEYTSTELTGRTQAGGSMAVAGAVRGKKRITKFTVLTTGHVDTDTVKIAVLPEGAIFLGGQWAASATVGTSTLSIGIAGDIEKYRADATFNGTLAAFGNTVALGLMAETTAEEEVIITYDTANPTTAITITGYIEYAEF